MRKNIFLKVIASITVVVFFATTATAGNSASVYSISVPEEHGTVSQRFKGDSDTTIIHIQDAHANLDAQVNLARVICSLIPQLSVEDNPFVGIEGAIGGYDLKSLRSFPIQDIKEKVGRDFVQNGTFIGAEYASVIAEQDFTLFGVEDPELFGKNFKAFYKVSEEQERLHGEMARIEAYIEELKAATYNVHLLGFDMQAVRYERQDVTLFDYLGELYQKIDECGLDLTTFMNLSQFREVFVIERGIDYDRLDQEVAFLVDELSMLSSAASVASVEKLYQDYTEALITRKEIVLALTGIAMKEGVSLTRYTILARARSFYSKYALIDFGTLLREIIFASNQVRISLAITKEEMLVVDLWSKVMTMKQLLSLKALKQDVDQFRADRMKHSIQFLYKGIQVLAERKGLPLSMTAPTFSVDDILRVVDEFYRYAEMRNDAMVDNLVQEMQTQGQTVGVLVAGGFHSEGVTEILRKRGISYLTVTPQIDRLVEDVAYMDRMMGKIVPVDTIMTSFFQMSNLSVALNGIASLLEEFGYEEGQVSAVMQHMESNFLSKALAMVGAEHADAVKAWGEDNNMLASNLVNKDSEAYATLLDLLQVEGIDADTAAEFADMIAAQVSEQWGEHFENSILKDSPPAHEGERRHFDSHHMFEDGNMFMDDVSQESKTVDFQKDIHMTTEESFEEGAAIKSSVSLTEAPQAAEKSMQNLTADTPAHQKKTVTLADEGVSNNTVTKDAVGDTVNNNHANSTTGVVIKDSTMSTQGNRDAETHVGVTPSVEAGDSSANGVETDVALNNTPNTDAGSSAAKDAAHAEGAAIEIAGDATTDATNAAEGVAAGNVTTQDGDFVTDADSAYGADAAATHGEHASDAHQGAREVAVSFDADGQMRVTVGGEVVSDVNAIAEAILHASQVGEVGSQVSAAQSFEAIFGVAPTAFLAQLGALVGSAATLNLGAIVTQNTLISGAQATLNVSIHGLQFQYGMQGAHASTPALIGANVSTGAVNIGQVSAVLQQIFGVNAGNISFSTSTAGAITGTASQAPIMTATITNSAGEILTTLNMVNAAVTVEALQSMDISSINTVQTMMQLAEAYAGADVVTLSQIADAGSIGLSDASSVMQQQLDALVPHAQVQSASAIEIMNTGEYALTDISVITADGTGTTIGVSSACSVMMSVADMQVTLAEVLGVGVSDIQVGNVTADGYTVTVNGESLTFTGSVVYASTQAESIHDMGVESVVGELFGGAIASLSEVSVHDGVMSASVAVGNAVFQLETNGETHTLNGIATDMIQEVLTVFGEISGATGDAGVTLIGIDETPDGNAVTFSGIVAGNALSYTVSNAVLQSGAVTDGAAITALARDIADAFGVDVGDISVTDIVHNELGLGFGFGVNGSEYQYWQQSNGTAFIRNNDGASGWIHMSEISAILDKIAAIGYTVDMVNALSGARGDVRMQVAAVDENGTVVEKVAYAVNGVTMLIDAEQIVDEEVMHEALTDMSTILRGAMFRYGMNMLGEDMVCIEITPEEEVSLVIDQDGDEPVLRVGMGMVEDVMVNEQSGIDWSSRENVMTNTFERTLLLELVETESGESALNKNMHEALGAQMLFEGINVLGQSEVVADVLRDIVWEAFMTLVKSTADSTDVQVEEEIVAAVEQAIERNRERLVAEEGAETTEQMEKEIKDLFGSIKNLLAMVQYNVNSFLDGFLAKAKPCKLEKLGELDATIDGVITNAAKAGDEIVIGIHDALYPEENNEANDSPSQKKIRSAIEYYAQQGVTIKLIKLTDTKTLKQYSEIYVVTTNEEGYNREWLEDNVGSILRVALVGDPSADGEEEYLHNVAMMYFRVVLSALIDPVAVGAKEKDVLKVDDIFRRVKAIDETTRNIFNQYMQVRRTVHTSA